MALGGASSSEPAGQGGMSALLRELASAPAPSSPAPRLRPGAVVAGRFELVEEMGRGGFGVVYEARDRQLGRSVAFKVIRAGTPVRPGEERLLREAEAAARLTHPNIVTLYDMGRCENWPFLVLELLLGETLRERLARGPVAVGEAVRIATEVSRGLAYAHAQGVVHRDLTPGNVFLCRDGQVKLLDLGMAHFFGSRKVDGGTRAFMAPEQLRGAPEDERTDVFALGVVLHRMLSGELPFADGKAAAGPRPGPLLDVPGVPALGPLVARMLSKDPVDRPRDGDEVRAALDIVQGELMRAGGAPPARMRRRFLGKAAAPVAAGALAALALAALSMQGRQAAAPAAAPGTPIASIAVLPFDDMSQGADQGYFAEGLAEEIRTALAQVEGLRVVGRVPSGYYKRKDASLSEIGRELGVAAVLEGGVRRDGNRLRITAEVVTAADGYRTWSQSYDRQLTDVFAVQEEIARAVAEALKVKFLPNQAPRRVAANQQAYTLTLLGRSLCMQGTEADYRRAVAALEKAIELDPTYAPAHAALAWASGDLALGFVPAEAPGLVRRAFEEAEATIRLEPRFADGWAKRGWLRTVFAWDWEGAQADFDRARGLISGGSEIVPVSYAVLLQKQGRLAEAIASTREGLEIAPLHAVAWANLGAFQAIAGDLGSAREALSRSLEISPGNALATGVLAQVDLLDGLPAAALAAFERSGNEVERLYGTALARRALGQETESRRALEVLTTRHAADAPYLIAAVHAWRGERDQAFQWLERAYATHDYGLRNLKVDPLLRGLHADPRFAAMLRKMNLPLD